jgi:hypothetical protein
MSMDNIQNADIHPNKDTEQQNSHSLLVEKQNITVTSEGKLGSLL